jgi:Uncharacterized flavoproteins
MNKISDSVYYVGVFNPNLRVFDIVMKTDFGTSYNSYIVKAQKTALIEACHASFFDSYVENIKKVCDLDSIDYIILNHTEPDHTGSLDELLKLIPNAKIVCSKAASIYLKNITNRDNLNFVIAKDNDELDLGGKKLKFINAPFLHWPDSMFTYLEDEGVLFTCDFLGAHYCEPYVFDYKIKFDDKYQLALKNYYDAIFGPFKNYVVDGLNKICDLKFDFVCTSHGPVLTKNKLDYVIEKYGLWSLPHKNSVKTIPIFYCSAYGNTLKLAQKIKEGIISQISDANVQIYNIIDYDMGFLHAQLNLSDAFLIGTPTINRDAVPPIWNLLSGIDAINNQKKSVAVFGSFGWSGEAVKFINDRLRNLKLNVFGDGFKVNFVPSEKELSDALQFGSEFTKAI